MSQKRSRVVKYAELRHKIESMTFEDEDSNLDQAAYNALKTDDDSKRRKARPNSPKVIHNTLSIPLEELLKDGKYKNRRAMMNTQEFKALDTKPEEYKKTKNGTSGTMVSSNPKKFKNIMRKWWAWVLIALLLAIIVGMIIYFSLAY